MIVAMRRVVLEVPMVVVVVVGVRGDGELVVRRGGAQVDRRRRRRSLLLLDAQMPDRGGDVGGAAAMLLVLMVVMRRDADGRFRAAGAVLDGGAHRAYDDQLALRSVAAHRATADRAWHPARFTGGRGNARARPSSPSSAAICGSADSQRAENVT